MAIGKLLLNLRKAENIKRYQVEINIVPRSVAEHTDFVMKLCYVLAKWEERKFGNVIDWKRLFGVTFHDGIEAWTGDIISYTKRTVPEMMEAVRLTEESFFESGMRKDIPASWISEIKQFVLMPKDDSIEGKILEAADTLDVVFECREELIRQNKEPFEEILRSALNKLIHIDIDSCQYFIKFALNDLKLQEYYTEDFKKHIDELEYDDEIFQNKRSILNVNEILISDYNIEKHGEDNVSKLTGNAAIFSVDTKKALTIKEIKELKLFISPIDLGVYRIKGNCIVREEAYKYVPHR
jgi:putative hydrolases of HD superfamily